MGVKENRSERKLESIEFADKLPESNEKQKFL